MVIGCSVNWMAYRYKTQGRECGVSDTNLRLSLLMYTSYFVLFARFFYNSYFRRREAGKKGEDQIKQIKKEEFERLVDEKEPRPILKEAEPKPEVVAEKIIEPQKRVVNIPAEASKSSEDENTDIERKEIVEQLDNDSNSVKTTITTNSYKEKDNKDRKESVDSNQAGVKENANQNLEHNQKPIV